jgi:hypothetical protein
LLQLKTYLGLFARSPLLTMDDTQTVKNGQDHSTETSPLKTHTINKEEIDNNDDTHENLDSLKESKDAVSSKAEGDSRPANGSNRDGTPAHTHPNRGEKQVKVQWLLIIS